MNRYIAFCGLDCERCEARGSCPEMATCDRVGVILGNSPEARRKLIGD